VLLAFDDGSQDRTIAELEACIPRASFPLRIVHNGSNLGYLRNFEQAILRCDTDIIVLSDQDDWWRPDKLEKIEAAFQRDAQAAGIFSDGEIVDEKLNSLGYGVLDALKVTQSERASAQDGRLLPVLLRRNIVAGAAFAFRSDWKQRVLPIPASAVHDEWIALIIAGHGALRFLPDRLIRYRQHGGNQLGLRRMDLGERFRSLLRSRRPEIERQAALMDNLRERLVRTAAPALTLKEIDGKIAHLRRRLSLPKSRLMRAQIVAEEVTTGRYSRYSSSWRSAVRDLVSPM
jgi:glycosyltransferase involved in cell wall biosynthesis